MFHNRLESIIGKTGPGPTGLYAPHAQIPTWYLSPSPQHIPVAVFNLFFSILHLASQLKLELSYSML
jgi:hypothetical protein